MWRGALYFDAPAGITAALWNKRICPVASNSDLAGR
jgi:hypothetical protein